MYSMYLYLWVKVPKIKRLREHGENWQHGKGFQHINGVSSKWNDYLTSTSIAMWLNVLTLEIKMEIHYAVFWKSNQNLLPDWTCLKDHLIQSKLFQTVINGFFTSKSNPYLIIFFNLWNFYSGYLPGENVYGYLFNCIPALKPVRLCVPIYMVCGIIERKWKLWPRMLSC